MRDPPLHRHQCLSLSLDHMQILRTPWQSACMDVLRQGSLDRKLSVQGAEVSGDGDTCRPLALTASRKARLPTAVAEMKWYGFLAPFTSTSLQWPRMVDICRTLRDMEATCSIE